MNSLSAAGKSSDRARRRLAWAAPVVVAGAVAAAVTLSTGSASGASPNLKPRTAAALLAAVQRTTATAFSGDVTETADLGIPSLPGAKDSASLSWQTFVTGSHSARVWADGRDKQRVALLGELSEADVVHNGNDVWTYTSASNTVTRTTLPKQYDKKGSAARPGAVTPSDITPAAVAARVLKAVSPTTKVTVDSSRTVAGRAAYTLVLQPRDARSTVRKVTIAIDATKFIPLQVQVFGAASTPAFQVGFTSISYATPAASTFDFRKPAGATVSNDPFGARDRHGIRNGDRHGKRPAGPAGAARHANHRPLMAGTARHKVVAPKVIGSGWTSVLELANGSAADLGNGTLRELTNPVGTKGQRLLHTALINAVIMPDGRTFVGALEPAVLEHIAATTPR